MNGTPLPSETPDYVRFNRANWDERVPAHAASPDYAVERFRSDPDFLSDVVCFDRPLLGPVEGLRGVHLQCHIGTDTISLARLGARMTGLDFSAPAVAAATELSEATAAGADFVQADVYDAADVLEPGSFDLVYTGIGALCWLPDVRRWADVVARLLTPGGRLFIREGHPMLWSLGDSRPDGLLVVEHPYRERLEPTVWDEDGTYVETDVEFEHTITHEWNHGIGDILTAVLDAGLTITSFVEHDSAPWDPLPGLTERDEDLQEWRLADRPWRVPFTYTLQAVRGAGA
ncbi:MAG: class I SAM-dependent methyltransferase [Nocardioides sp.]|uniref:class I SAM-dependent methyltransferase n=1 Tax=Nocardioides sp. TaxID=35761 RepID=UPI00238BDF63|nr:class I SAM-dependent methyltransferase [Nocardioides sp.]MDE0777343.1 class I SAM-dependent methyltransferase [Nocardioides sp.]